jgi:hypothetical protein
LEHGLFLIPFFFFFLHFSTSFSNNLDRHYVGSRVGFERILSSFQMKLLFY